MPKWYRENAYLRQDFTGWGVGLWKDKWHNIDTSIENFNDMFVKNYTKVSKYYKRALSQLISIKDSKDKNTVYVNYNVVSMNDGLLLLNMIDKNIYSVYPINTKVVNRGLDGSGARLNKNTNLLNRVFHRYYLSSNMRYLRQTLSDTSTEYLFNTDLEVNHAINKFIHRKTRPSFGFRLLLMFPKPVRKWVKSIFT